ncbi:MAG TPA: alpha/beta hydrolase [Bryobacteraceae bacterium]|jgi:alpha-L-fucosidase 2|nr:alpha/beta hydrolase [Bryobacteraceae bacterium]
MYARIGLSFLVLAFVSNFMSLAAQSPSLHFSPWQVKRDIEYSRVNGISLRLDAGFPAAAERVPAVILVHGGGWISGDRRIDVEPLFKPLREAGFAWFSISYRFATDILRFGVAIEDVESAIRFVKAHAAEFNVDGRRIALVGESAGGQLAAMAALRGHAGCSVRAVVALYAPTDLVYLLKNSRYVPTQIRDSVEGKPWERLILAGLARLSPIDNVRRDMPPFLFIHGTADPLVPFAQSRDMCERMRKAGASCEIYPVQGAGHGIRWWESYPKLASGYKHKLVQWLNEQMCNPLTAKS